MKFKALFLLLIAVACLPSLFSLAGSVTAQNIAASKAVAALNGGETRLEPAQKFAKAIMRNDFDEAQKYIDKSFVQIPEIRENSPIRGIQLVPSPEKGVKILLANFYDEGLKGERLAFIWELVVKGDRITRIRVLFDGANPLVDEGRLFREYQLKFKRHVLVPTEFPFKITHFNGFVDNNESLEFVYRNDELNGFFRVKAFPIVGELERYKRKDDVYYLLKDGTKALYWPNFEWGYELRFQKNGMQYTLAIGNKKMLKAKFKAEDMLKIANSMV
ncbi:hypothetical protein KP806_19560 [Paenibacillus sp. N4]|uniref:hypothetical protein n=1 Tax=Paenibacillus vietnamensis TaxID=2590547 RepID=UPI001CD17643|nr:hypothetical protein [Paenibacillus vietnamensis]MCA0757262.1 hypothetical protein [Paenibacillus vietnamensis]